MNNDQLAIEVSTDNGVTVVSPRGDIDLARSPVLRQSLQSAQSSKPKRLVVDLAMVDYMDSSGVATLVEALQAAQSNATKMVLCNLQNRVQSIFEIARLDTIFTIQNDLRDAIGG